MRKWTKDELVLALYAYCHVPFNKASNTNEWIIRVADIIGRTPAAVKMKIGNFGVFDPQLRAKGIVGLSGTSKLDKEVWETYYGHWDQLAFDAEVLLADAEGTTVDSNWVTPEGVDVMVLTKRRINQTFFRSAVLASYDNTCCVTGITNPKLLEACHIIPWSEDQSVRTDPKNGLCLSPTFHKAFDELLISVTPNYELKVSDRFLSDTSEESFRAYLESKKDSKIILPDRFLPNKEFLESHYQQFLRAI